MINFNLFKNYLSAKEKEIEKETIGLTNLDKGLQNIVSEIDELDIDTAKKIAFNVDIALTGWTNVINESSDIEKENHAYRLNKRYFYNPKNKVAILYEWNDFGILKINGKKNLIHPTRSVNVYKLYKFPKVAKNVTNYNKLKQKLTNYLSITPWDQINREFSEDIRKKEVTKEEAIKYVLEL